MGGVATNYQNFLSLDNLKVNVPGERNRDVKFGVKYIIVGRNGPGYFSYQIRFLALI